MKPIIVCARFQAVKDRYQLIPALVARGVFQNFLERGLHLNTEKIIFSDFFSSVN